MELRCIITQSFEEKLIVAYGPLSVYSSQESLYK